MKNNTNIIKFIAIILLLQSSCLCQSNTNEFFKSIKTNATLTEDFVKGFQNPPLYAKPRVFWWWLNSMATKESITRDLVELKDKGFGGAMIFDAGSSSYKVAHKTEPGPVFGSAEWKELFVFALNEANRLGLELSLNIQSGWNPGGPTVTPEDAMKKIVWTEKKVSGPARFSGQLPQEKGEFYKNITIQAYRIKTEEKCKPIKYLGYKSLYKQLRGKGVYLLHLLHEQEQDAQNDFDLKSEHIINLSDKLDKSGFLKWDVPEGEWTILRFGYVLTESEVSTSSDGYEGLSFDHLSTKALENFFSDVVDPILLSGGDLVGESLKYLHTDSWEMKLTNWTKNFCEDFREMRGYDMTTYLPVLAGRIVNSREISNRFLYDFRKTVSDCIADRMYSQFAKLAHERGLLIHPESGGPHSAPIDGLKCLGRNDVPMGEFWARANTHRVEEDARLFIKQSSCAAHIYGKRFVAGEGPTTIGPQWERSPKDLKNVFDRNFCEGINRFFWHCFTSSPKEFGLPGNEYFAGTHLNPNATWWHQSKGFVDYLARCSFLLSQGLFQADVCFYYGDDAPNFVLRKRTIVELGSGFDYDECTAEVILLRMAVKDQKIVLPDGMSYRLLRLPDREAITLEVLEKIEQLVKDGATIVGQKPRTSTGLRGYPESEEKVKKIADRLWGVCDGITLTQNKYGNGRVFWGKPMRKILLDDGLLPDFSYQSSQDSSQLDYIHRKADDADIYFVVNKLARQGIFDTKYRYLTDLPDRYERVDCSFRVKGKVPEIWDPMTGEISKVSIFREEDGVTVVPLHLKPEGSLFVLFREKSGNPHIVSLEKDGRAIFPVIAGKPGELSMVNISHTNDKINVETFEDGNYKLALSDGQKKSIHVKNISNIVLVEGKWDVHFPKGWGAPEKTVFNKLISWTESTMPGMRYFSGIAEYRKSFTITKSLLSENKLYLDLGNVQEMAEVFINGKSLGILWMPPFITEITEFVNVGKNEFEIQVVNLWPNRLIGDQLLAEEKRFTKTNIHKFKKSDELRISGLLGPVRIIPTRIVPVN
jgi:hypothetical protein